MERLKVIYQYTRNGIKLHTPNLICAGKRRDENTPVFIVEPDDRKVELTLT